MKKGAPGGVFFRFNVWRSGAGAAHVRYLTRLPATGADLGSIYIHNIPGIAESALDYRETRKALITYAQTKEELELERRCQGRPKAGQERVIPRTHYRAILSLEGRIEQGKTLAMAREFLMREFPLARAAAAVHSDTEHTHVHVNIFARQTNNRKVQIGDRDYRRLDERWAEIYGETFGQEKLAQHLAKKAEMADAKRAYFAGLEAIRDRTDLSASDRDSMRRDFRENFAWPERSPERLGRERYREREERNRDQSGVRGDQRETQSRNHQVEERGRGEGRSGTAAERAAGAAERALRGLERATERSREISDRGQRLYSRERERDRGR